MNKCLLCHGKGWFHYFPRGIIPLARDETCVKKCPNCSRYDETLHAAQHQFERVDARYDGYELVIVASRKRDPFPVETIVRILGGEPTALFIGLPGMAGDPESCVSYSTRHGHGWVNLATALEVSKPADNETEQDMVGQLERLGYDPVLRKRMRRTDWRDLQDANNQLKGPINESAA